MLLLRLTEKVAELDVKLGDTVKKGQLLAKLDDANLQYKLDAAQLALLEADFSGSDCGMRNWLSPRPRQI